MKIPQSPVGQHQKVSKEGGRLLSQVNVVQARVEELGNINENKSSSQKLRFCQGIFSMYLEKEGEDAKLAVMKTYPPLNTLSHARG